MTDAMETSDGSHAPLPLDRNQRRVLGVLVEKAFCTPEYYPLTINAIVTGCNQKSNRDPVMSLIAADAEDALMELMKIGLTTRVYPASGRAERWRHNLKDFWSLDRPHRAVLAELLLRGAQTEGDLRSRASRMVDIPTLEELRDLLTNLEAQGFVKRLSPQEQKRGVIWTHLLLKPKELDRVLETAAQTEQQATNDTSNVPERPVSSAAPKVQTVDNSDRVAELETSLQNVMNQLSELTQKFEELSQAHDKLDDEFRQLREDLGT